jgi:hypothetical protein
MAAMEEDWIFIGDAAGCSSDTDSASDDDDSGFMIVRRGRKGGDHSVVVRVDAAAQPRVAAVAMPQPTPPGPGLSFRVVSSDGGGRREHPGCNDEPSESFHDDIDNDRSDTEDDFSGSDEEAENGNRDIFHMLFPRAMACDANIDNYEDESEHVYIDDDEEDENGSSFDIDSSDGEEEAATATTACDWYNAEDDGIADVAENGNQDIFDMLLPRERTIDDAAMTSANIFRMLFPRAKACESENGYIDYEAEFGMLLPRECAIHADIDSSDDGEEDAATVTADIFRMLFPTATACVANIGDSEDGSEHRYIDYEAEFGMLLPRECAIIDDYEDESEHVYIDYEAEFGMLLPRERALFTSAAQSGPAEALFTFTVRSRERALVAIEDEVRRRREAAQQELDRALARQAAAAAEALESALRGGTTTAKRQATGVTQPAVADLDAPADFNFIIGVCMFVYLVVSLFL